MCSIFGICASSPIFLTPTFESFWPRVALVKEIRESFPKNHTHSLIKIKQESWFESSQVAAYKFMINLSHDPNGSPPLPCHNRILIRLSPSKGFIHTGADLVWNILLAILLSYLGTLNFCQTALAWMTSINGQLYLKYCKST